MARKGRGGKITRITGFASDVERSDNILQAMVMPIVCHKEQKMNFNIEPGQKALITTDNWFFAPDGNSYRAVFGTVKAARTAEETLGVRPNGKSTNWYVEIGNMTIAGCQIHYAVRTDTCNDGPSKQWSSSAEQGCREYFTPCSIYFADKA